MASRSKIKLALVGSDTLRGREIKDLLSRSDWKPIDLEFMDADVKEEFAKLTDFREEARAVHALQPEELDGKDLVFLAADKKTSRLVGRRAGGRTFRALDLTESFNDDPKVPLIVAGVNEKDLDRKRPPLVANPHPVTIILSHLFHALLPVTGLAKAVVFVLEPVSAQDDAGIRELAGQSAALLSGADPEKKIFPQQIAFNLLSHMGAPDERGFSAIELRIPAEVRRVLGRPELPLFLTTIHAPVFHGYSLMAYLELEKNAEITGLEALFAANPHFAVTSFRQGPEASPLSVAGKGEIFVGLVKQEASAPRSFWVWLVADNLTRGSALNAYGIARKLLEAKAR